MKVQRKETKVHIIKLQPYTGILSEVRAIKGVFREKSTINKGTTVSALEIF